MTTPAKPYESDASIAALEGTTHSLTGLDYPPKDVGPDSSPAIWIRWWRILKRLADIGCDECRWFIDRGVGVP